VISSNERVNWQLGEDIHGFNARGSISGTADIVAWTPFGAVRSRRAAQVQIPLSNNQEWTGHFEVAGDAVDSRVLAYLLHPGTALVCCGVLQNLNHEACFFRAMLANSAMNKTTGLHADFESVGAIVKVGSIDQAVRCGFYEADRMPLPDQGRPGWVLGYSSASVALAYLAYLRSIARLDLAQQRLGQTVLALEACIARLEAPPLLPLENESS
jgi:hypothetical protein